MPLIYTLRGGGDKYCTQLLPQCEDIHQLNQTYWLSGQFLLFSFVLQLKVTK